MKAFPRVVSFFTYDTPYQWLSESLLQSCQETGTACDIQGIPSFGSWEMNCCFKPLFLLQMLAKWKEPLLWVDVDASLQSPLTWGDFFFSDVAVRVMEGCSIDHPSKIITGSVYINNSEPAVKLLKLWAERCMQELAKADREKEVWDQDILRLTIAMYQEPLVVGILPMSYAIIHHEGPFKEICDNPIIIHGRASRLFKGWVNKRE